MVRDDQLSEKFHTASPYAYVMNNPAMLIDPDGRDAMFSSGTEEILNQYMVNTYWRQNSSLIPSYSGSALFGFSGINAPTQYSSVLKYWTSSLTVGQQNFDFDFYGERNGEIQGDYASMVLTQMTITDLNRWTADSKRWESGILNNIDYAATATALRKISSKANTFNKILVESSKRLNLYGNPASFATDYVRYEKEIKLLGKSFGRIQTPAISMSAKTVGVLKTTTGVAARVLGVAGVATGVFDMAQNGVNVSNTLDTTMSTLALIPGTQTIAAVYFMSNFAVTYFTGQDIGQHIQGYFEQ